MNESNYFMIISKYKQENLKIMILVPLLPYMKRELTSVELQESFWDGANVSGMDEK